MAELAHAYVSIRASTGGMQGDVRKALTGIEADAGKTGQSMGQKLSSGLGNVLKKTAVGVGVAGGAALAAGLTKGIGRLNQIEQAEAKLTGLGNSASDVGSIMENALASVKGTSYGLEEAATIAASAVAAGVQPGQELERTLTITGDAAAIAGVELNEMGSIINKVATSDMMQMDVANQLMDAGIPILQMVGQELGVTAEEARKMASAGEVSFEIFQNALEQGVGGAALEMGNTTQGAFANMGAAAGRLGATIAGPFFTQAAGAFTGITGLLDDLNEIAGPAMESVAAWLERAGQSASDAFSRFRESAFAREAMADLGQIFSSLAGTAADVWPSLVRIGEALGEAAQALGVSAWTAFIAALEVGAGVLDALTGPLELVASAMERMPHLVTAAVAGWMAFRTVPAVMGRVTTAVGAVRSAVTPAITNVRAFGSAWQDSMRWAGQANPQLGTAGRAMFVLGQNASMAARGGLSALSNALGGPLNIGLMAAVAGLMAVTTHSQRAESQQDALRDSSERLAESQADVAEALQATGGELSSDVWSELESQIDSTRQSMDDLAATGPGFMGWAGAGIKASQQLYGAFKTKNLGMAESAAATIEATLEQSRMADQSEVAAEAIAGLGLTSEQLAERVYGSSHAWSHLRGQLDTTTEGGMAAATQLGHLRSQFEQQQAMIEAVGPGFYTLRDGLDTLADSASSADQKLNSMRSVLEQLGLIQTSAEQQIANVAESVERLGDAFDGSTFAVDEFDRAFQNADGSLNLLNTNTHSLNDALTGMQNELMGVASSGGDALGLFQGMQPELDGLRAKAEAAGIDFDGLLATYGMTPEAISTMVSLHGIDESQTDLIAIADKLSEVGVGVDVPVEIRGGEAGRQELEQLGIRVREFDAETGQATVYVDNDIALARIMDTQGLLGRLDNTTSISDIMAVNGDAQSKIWQSQSGLDQLDATNPLSQILAENGQAQGAIGETQGGLDNLGNTHPESKIRADNSQAGQAINQSKSWLDSIPGTKTVRVVFNAIYQGFRNITGADNAAGGAWDGSRALPRFATGGHSGYRLPTSGPGTEITDGFIAFNRDHVPAARLDAGEWIINGRSSEKYNRELAAINAGTFPKLPGYADGGRRDARELLDFVHGRGGHGQSRPLEGAPYVWGGINWGDCSGAMAAIARFAVGLAPFADRFATGNQREALLGMGFRLGRGGDGDLRFGWYNGGPGGGHTSGTLPDGTNVEMGGGRGNGQIGGGAAPASHSQYTDHAHLPIHTWQFAGIEGWDSLMPPGATGYTPDSMFEASPGLYSSPGNSGTSASADQPRTWSDLAAGAAAQLAGGQVEDLLGVFGVPNQLPPIIQAWQMLNERPGGGPSDWDLSTTAAEIKRLDAAVKIRQQVVDEAAKAIDAMNHSGVGNALPAAVVGAESELDKQLLELERDRLDYERAQSRLEDLLGARAAAVAEKDLTGGGQSAQSLSDALTQPPGTGIPDELVRELKMAYNPAGGAEQWRPMVVEALKRNGFAATQREQDLMIAQINTESGGDPNILQQIQDVNSGGNEAKGLLQIIPGTFAAHRDPELPNDRTDPWANMNAALRYYKSRYGMDLGAMWGKGHGYNLGGWIGGRGSGDTIPLVAEPGEFIVNRRAASENRELLEQINTGGSAQRGGVTYNIHTFDLDEAMRELGRREAQHAQTFMGAR